MAAAEGIGNAAIVVVLSKQGNIVTLEEEQGTTLEGIVMFPLISHEYTHECTTI